MTAKIAKTEETNELTAEENQVVYIGEDLKELINELYQNVRSVKSDKTTNRKLRRQLGLIKSIISEVEEML